MKAHLETPDKTKAKNSFVEEEVRRLTGDVLEVARMFPSIEAVCYKLEDTTFYVDFDAPKMAAEEHFEFIKTMTKVEDSQAFVRVEFYATGLPLDDYEVADYTVVKLDGES